MERPEYSGAHPPEREYNFDSDGCRLRLHEWGDPAGRPVLLCHGMWDHAHGFDLLAPLLAQQYRVIALDARGHGDSMWLDSYNWMQDVGDVMRVMRRFGRVHLVGHSRGGGLATHAACNAPEAVDKLVNIDGFGPPREWVGAPGQSTPPVPGSPPALTAFLDARRISHRRNDWRPYTSLEQLVSRRKRQNPRLSEGWLRYFCWYGSRRTLEGYRWKVDPLAGLGAGPWKPEWIGPTWQKLRAPLLALVGGQRDTWGPLESDLLDERLAWVANAERATIADAGHFPHMEQPELTARLLLDYLAA